MRDRDRIVHSKSFRRLKHKTQVFISPEGDHYRTRLTHTLEVAQIGRTIARALNLNEDLIEAIALGHDLGHTPFGHAGESVLDKLIDGGFSHNEQSLRIVEFLENDGKGLNLTFEIRDGIVNHKFSGKPATLEGEIIKYADRFAYINHDIEDAISAGVLKEEDLPKDCTEVLGHSKSARINSLILDIVGNSFGKPFVKQSPEFEAMHLKLHKFMFASVYTNPVAKAEEKKTFALIELLFQHYMTHPEELPAFSRSLLDLPPRAGTYNAHNSLSKTAKRYRNKHGHAKKRACMFIMPTDGNKNAVRRFAITIRATGRQQSDKTLFIRIFGAHAYQIYVSTNYISPQHKNAALSDGVLSISVDGCQLICVTQPNSSAYFSCCMPVILS